jgi:hypothetical protein
MGWTQKRTTKSGAERFRACYRDIRGQIQSAGTFAKERDADRAWQRAGLTTDQAVANWWNNNGAKADMAAVEANLEQTPHVVMRSYMPYEASRRGQLRWVSRLPAAAPAKDARNVFCCQWPSPCRRHKPASVG